MSTSNIKNWTCHLNMKKWNEMFTSTFLFLFLIFSRILRSWHAVRVWEKKTIVNLNINHLKQLYSYRYKVDLVTRFLTSCEKGDTFTVLDCLYLGVDINARYLVLYVHQIVFNLYSVSSLNTLSPCPFATMKT